MERAKSKVTLYMRPELHKMLKLNAVEQDMKMSELAEIMLERCLLQSRAPEVYVCPNCKAELIPSGSGDGRDARQPLASP